MPRLGGVVREVTKSLGDTVTAGEVMVVLDSPELADAKAAYLAARERLSLFLSLFDREKMLYEKQISPEQDFLRAKQELAEARIAEQKAVQTLLALGLSQQRITELPARPNQDLTRYEVVAPFAGTVIKRQVTLGEVVKGDEEIFTISDLETVWVDLQVYQKDLPHVRTGQQVRIALSGEDNPRTGKIGYVGPILGEETRTALARVVLPNPGGGLRPGLFVTASVLEEAATSEVVVPLSAVQTLQDTPCVFVRVAEGFEVRPVVLGQRTQSEAEVLSGLALGESYAAAGTFILKAELGKSEAAEE